MIDPSKSSHTCEQRIVLMNKRAVAMMERGEFSCAIREVSGELIAFRQETSSSPTMGGREALTHADFQEMRVCLDQCIMRHRCNRLIPPLANRGLPSDDDNTKRSTFAFLDNDPNNGCSPLHIQQSTFIHHQPLHIPESWDLNGVSQVQRATLLSIILLFNLALSCHLGALCEVREKESL